MRVVRDCVIGQLLANTDLGTIRVRDGVRPRFNRCATLRSGNSEVEGDMLLIGCYQPLLCSLQIRIVCAIHLDVDHPHTEKGWRSLANLRLSNDNKSPSRATTQYCRKVEQCCVQRIRINAITPTSNQTRPQTFLLHTTNSDGMQDLQSG